MKLHWRRYQRASVLTDANSPCPYHGLARAQWVRSPRSCVRGDRTWQIVSARCSARRLIGFLRAQSGIVARRYRINQERRFRLYLERKLTVRRRVGFNAGARDGGTMLVPVTPNDPCSLVFLSERLIGGRRFRILILVEDCARLAARRSVRRDVVHVSNTTCFTIGGPMTTTRPLCSLGRRTPSKIGV